MAFLVGGFSPPEKNATSSVGMLFHDPNCFWKVSQNSMVPNQPAEISGYIGVVFLNHSSEVIGSPAGMASLPLAGRAALLGPVGAACAEGSGPTRNKCNKVGPQFVS
jgi:hypothetical protein